MRELTKTQSYCFAAGALMMVVGVGCVIFGIMPKVFAIVFAIGAFMFATLQMTQTYSGNNITIRRLRRIMVIGDICFILSGLLMLENAYTVIYSLLATSIEGYNFYLHYFYNNWVVLLLIGAILELYTTHRISYERNRGVLTLLALASMTTVQAKSFDIPTRESVVAVARLTNDYFVQKWPDPTKNTFVKRSRPSSLWTRGVYYEGLMALYDIDPQTSYIEYTDQWGMFHKWTPRNGTKVTHADDQCCCQTYLDRYEQTGMKNECMIDSVRYNLDRQIATGRADYWTWIDAIQMAMPVYSKMYRLTGDEKYILYARDAYEWSRNTCGGGLWNAKEGLWWRDKDYVAPYKEKDGKNCYWSRGNGWVVVALIKTIEDIENASKNKALSEEVEAFRKELTSDYLAMMKALRKCQREDGFWNVSLVSPVTYGGKETSGTALFVAGMAWGVRKGMLKEKTYLPVIYKAWNGMVKYAVHKNGFLGYLQGTGKEPSSGQPVTYDSVPDFEDYGLGCFLLAAKEVYHVLGYSSHK